MDEMALEMRVKSMANESSSEKYMTKSLFFWLQNLKESTGKSSMFFIPVVSGSCGLLALLAGAEAL